jgi:hypothetical protein
MIPEFELIEMERRAEDILYPFPLADVVNDSAADVLRLVAFIRRIQAGGCSRCSGFSPALPPLVSKESL